MDCPTCSKPLATERGMRQHHTKLHGDPLPNRTCEDCGIEFYDPKSRRTYCEDCYSEAGEKNGNYSDATETTNCDRCGGSFEYYPSDKDGVYCPECVGNANGLLPDDGTSETTVEVSCEYCGLTLERHPSRVASASYGSFCDLDCYGEWLSENVSGEAHHQWRAERFPTDPRGGTLGERHCAATDTNARSVALDPKPLVVTQMSTTSNAFGSSRTRKIPISWRMSSVFVDPVTVASKTAIWPSRRQALKSNLIVSQSATD